MIYWYLSIRDIQRHETYLGNHESKKSYRVVTTLRKCHSEYGRNDLQQNITTISTQIFICPIHHDVKCVRL